MDPILEKLIGAMLRASWQAAALVLIVLAAQLILRKVLTPKWRHALWFLVVARLLILVAPASSFSVFNWMPPRYDPPPRRQPAHLTSPPAAPQIDVQIQPQPFRIET